MCVGGQAWVGEMLYRTRTSALVYNGYNTPVSTLPNITFVFGEKNVSADFLEHYQFLLRADRKSPILASEAADGYT